MKSESKQWLSSTSARNANLKERNFNCHHRKRFTVVVFNFSDTVSKIASSWSAIFGTILSHRRDPMMRNVLEGEKDMAYLIYCTTSRRERSLNELSETTATGRSRAIRWSRWVEENLITRRRDWILFAAQRPRSPEQKDNTSFLNPEQFSPILYQVFVSHPFCRQNTPKGALETTGLSLPLPFQNERADVKRVQRRLISDLFQFCKWTELKSKSSTWVSIASQGPQDNAENTDEKI